MSDHSSLIDRKDPISELNTLRISYHIRFYHLAHFQNSEHAYVLVYWKNYPNTFNSRLC